MPGLSDRAGGASRKKQARRRADLSDQTKQPAYFAGSVTTGVSWLGAAASIGSR